MTIIAIDGPGGAGKSTLARNLAGRLQMGWLDTGAMYRCVTLAALWAGVDPSDEEALVALVAKARIELGQQVLLDGKDVTEAIRTAPVDAQVSTVAAHPRIRAELVDRQRAWVRERGGGIVEGRDITTVVLPQADLRLYVTAAGDERAERRVGERPGSDPATVRASIAVRDELDAGRAASPLRLGEGVVVVDTTGRTPDQVLEEVLGLVEAATGVGPTSPGARLSSTSTSRLTIASESSTSSRG